MTKITADDRIRIKNLRIEKQWAARRMVDEGHMKNAVPSHFNG